MEDGHGGLSRREFVKVGAGLAATTVIGGIAAPLGARAAAPAVHVRGKTQTLHIAANGTFSTGQGKVFAAFEAKHPDVKVKVTSVQAADWPVYFTKVLTMIAGGNGPDLTYVDTSGIQQFAAQGLAAPLTDYVKRDKAELMGYFAEVHPTLIESMMYKGDLYELPIEFNAVDMFYDPLLLKAAGFSAPSSSWTKDDFYRIAKATTKKSGKQTTVYGYGWVNRIWGGWTQWANVNGGDLLEYGKYPGGSWLWDTFYKGNALASGRGGGIHWGQPTANLPANVEALQFVLDLTKDGIAPVATVSGGGALQNFFAAKKLAMTPGGGFWAGGLHQAGMAPGTFDVQLWPRWKSQRTHFGCGGWLLFKSSGSKDIAWEFIKYSVSKPAETIVLADNTSTPGRRPFLTPARYAPTGPQHWDVFYPTLDRSLPFCAPTYYSRFNDILVKYTGNAVAGTSSAKDALDGMQRELQGIYAANPK